MSNSASSFQPREKEGVLQEEFEHEPVPVSHRRPLGQVAAVWFGFPMVITSAVFGGVIAYSLGLWAGLGAIVLGNLILLAYVGSLSYVAGERGVNFALQAEGTFGTWGRRFASAFLATIVVGWYAFQTGLTGATLHTSFGWNESLIIVIAIILYTGVTFIGIRALSVLGMVAAPLFIVLGLVALGLLSADHGIGGLTSFRGVGAISFGGAVTIVIAGFADSGTMTADFTRWSRNGREALYATITAFPFANLVAQAFGVIIVCAGAAAAPSTAGGDFTPVLIQHGALLAAIAVIFIFINLGSVCTHCLYNGAVGWSNLSGSTMRTLTIILGILGGIAALAGVWSLFLGWLTVLGIFVPPIGTVLIADQLILRKPISEKTAMPFEIDALIAWAIGSIVAFIVHFYVTGFSDAVAGMIVSLIAYAILSPAVGRRSRARVRP